MAKNNAGKSEKKLVSRREFLVGGGAVIAAIALAACSQKTVTSIATATATATKTVTAAVTPTMTSTIPQPTSTIPTATTTSPGTSTLTPKYGGTLRQFGSSGSTPFGWPPDIIYTGAELALETLLRGDNKGEVNPWLAETYKVADDFTSITFNLKKGIKFSDGSDFNAAVAKWNLDNMIDAKKEPYWASVDLIDDYTIRVNLTKWVCTIPMSFAEGNTVAYMVSKKAFDEKGKDWMRWNEVGTGPFIQVMYKRDVGKNYVRNPDYWIEGKPYLDGINAIYVTEYTTQKMVMEAGEVDVGVSLQPQDMAHFKELGWDVSVIMEDSEALVFDTANPDSPYANQKVREAVEYAIDKEAIAKAFGYGYRVAPYQIPPRASTAYDPNFTLNRKYDLEKAKQLLVEAGHPDGLDTTILQWANPAIQDITIAMQADLAKAGIRAQLKFIDSGEWMASYAGPNGKWPTGTMIFSPVPRFDRSFIGGLNFLSTMIGQSWLRTPEWTQAYNAALAAPAADIQLIRAVTDIITRDASIIPVTELGSVGTKKPYVMLERDQRAFMSFGKPEEVWMNK